MGNQTVETKPRHIIIDISVQLESNISTFLSAWLSVKKEESRSFGSKSSSLSFFQLTNLILDMKILEKDDTKKLEYFGQIRNKFAHDVTVESYSDCLNSIDGLRNKLKSIYGKRELQDKEEHSQILITLLAMDMVLIGDKLIKKLKDHLGHK